MERSASTRPSELRLECKIRAQYADVFANGAAAHAKGRWLLDPNNPWRRAPAPFALPDDPRGVEGLPGKVQTLLSKRLIKKSSLPCASPVTFVPQGIDDSGKPKIRMVIDCRALNKIAVKDRFPLPHPEDLIAKPHGMKCFTKLDFWSGFHQHCCHPEIIVKTVFIGPEALYEWLVISFGGANASSEFMRLMADLHFEDVDKGCCIVFMDDILVLSRTAQDNEHHVRAVLDAIKEVGFRLHGSKRSFGRSSAPFLGLNIDGDDPEGASIRMIHEKIKAIADWPYPGSPKEMRSFVGLSGVYRKFVPGFAKVSAPLMELMYVEQ